MAVYGELASADVGTKGGHDLVTRADHESEESLKRSLGALLPDAGFLGEETGWTGDRGTAWVVDPLDGTRNFVHGLPMFAVSIALVSDGAPVLGVVLDVPRDEAFVGSRGSGAWSETAGVRRPLRVSDRSSLEGCLAATGFPHRVKFRLESFLSQFAAIFEVAGGVRRMGAAALDLAHTAAGRYDLFWEGGLNSWDVAAGALLVREAGGMATDWLGDDAGLLETGDVLATNGLLHADSVALLADASRGEA